MKYLSSLLLFAIVFSTSSFAGSKIILEDNKNNYTQTETGYILNFDLVATAEEFAAISGKVAEMSDRLSLEAQLSPNSTYKCVFTVDHQNQPEYVYKMLLSIGITSIEHKGTVLPLDRIIEILYAYQQ